MGIKSSKQPLLHSSIIIAQSFPSFTLVHIQLHRLIITFSKMQSFVVVAFLLASLAFANSIEVQRMSSTQQQSASSSSTSFNSGNGGGFAPVGGIGDIAYGGGGGRGVSSYSEHSSSSSSFSSVISSFSGLSSRIASAQSMIASGSFTQSIATQEMSQIAESMQLALSQSVGCGCFGQGNLISTAGAAFSQFSSLMSSMQSTFGQENFGTFLQPFGALTESFQSFSYAISSAGYSTSHVFPAGFPSVLCEVIPDLTEIIGFK